MALALFTVFGVLASKNDQVSIAFLAVGFVYVAGAASCGLALWPRTYGALGSDPSAWLRSGVIDGGESALPASLAYEVFFHDKRIRASADANQWKVIFIRAALIAGMIAPVMLAVWIWRLA